LEKLNWLNGEYLRGWSLDRFAAAGRRALERAGLSLAGVGEPYVMAALQTCLGKVRVLEELPAYAGFYFTDELEYDPVAAAKHFVPENAPRLGGLRKAFAEAASFDPANLESTLKLVAAGLGVKPAVLIHACRLACTGKSAGPSLYHLLEVLGRDRVTSRLDRAIARMTPAAG
jgi:glutamyl-tRNA synthetase